MRTYWTAQGTLLSALCDLNGKEIQGRGDIGACVADSLRCIAEPNTTLQRLDSNLKKKSKKKTDIFPLIVLETMHVKSKCWQGCVPSEASSRVCPSGVNHHPRPPFDRETMETVRVFVFWAPKSLQMVTAAMKLKDVSSLEEKL